MTSLAPALPALREHGQLQSPSFPCPSQAAGSACWALGLSACLQVFVLTFWKASGSPCWAQTHPQPDWYFSLWMAPMGAGAPGTFLWPLPLHLTSNGSLGYASGLQTHVKHQTLGSCCIQPTPIGLGCILLSLEPEGLASGEARDGKKVWRAYLMERSCPRSECHLHRGVIDEVNECNTGQS